MAPAEVVVNGNQREHTAAGGGARHAQDRVTPVTLPALEKWSVAYHQLMAGYAHALGEAARSARGRAGETPEETAERFKKDGARVNVGVFHPMLLRLLVGAHVRKRLDLLAARCSQLELTLAPANNAKRRAWLHQVREEAEQTASTLPSLRVPGILAIVPFA